MRMCNQCHRAGEASLAACGQFMTCPGRDPDPMAPARRIDPNSERFPEIDPAKTVILSCPRCNVTAAIPVHDFVTGKTTTPFRCDQSKANCPATMVTSLEDTVTVVKGRGRKG